MSPRRSTQPRIRSSRPLRRGWSLWTSGRRPDATPPEPHPLVAEPDGSNAEWWLSQLGPWTDGRIPVSAFVPASLPAVCQVFHRWRNLEGHPVTWAQTARSLGFESVRALDATRDVHGHFTALAAGFESSIGDIDSETAEALVPLLAAGTSTPDDVFVAVWTGYGDEPQRRFPGAALVPTIARGHFLLRGPLAGVIEPMTVRAPPTGAIPGIWWPADRAWLLHTEIDYEWTFVAGSETLIERLVGDPRLEVARTTFDAPANRAREPQPRAATSED